MQCVKRHEQYFEHYARTKSSVISPHIYRSSVAYAQFLFVCGHLVRRRGVAIDFPMGKAEGSSPVMTKEWWKEKLKLMVHFIYR